VILLITLAFGVWDGMVMRNRNIQATGIDSVICKPFLKDFALIV
jgi:hypothetical protein